MNYYYFIFSIYNKYPKHFIWLKVYNQMIVRFYIYYIKATVNTKFYDIPFLKRRFKVGLKL
jgi:hypothetical protein